MAGESALPHKMQHVLHIGNASWAGRETNQFFHRRKSLYRSSLQSIVLIRAGFGIPTAFFPWQQPAPRQAISPG
jgi:hypothetical protein